MSHRLRYLSMLLLPALLAQGCAMLPAGPDNLYELRREAQTAYAESEDARAEKLLLGLVRSVPNDAEAWFYLGNLYARSNRPEQAVEAYQKSLMLNRADARAWHNMGVVRMREAWAAFIQAHATAANEDPLRARIEAIIGAMEKVPLEGFSRAPAAKPLPAAPSQNGAAK